MVAVPVLAAVTDRIDARLIVLLGMGFAAAGLFGFAFAAEGFWGALAWRFVSGIGLAGTYMPGLRALTDRLPDHIQARAVAFYTSSFSIGTGGSYALAGVALELVGWRGAFVAAGLGPVVSGILIWLVLRPKPPDPQHRPDTHLFDFRPVLVDRRVMGYVLAYAGHTAELFAMRSWLVPFLVFSVAYSSAGGEATVDATLMATLVSLIAVVSSIGGNEIAMRIGRRRFVMTVMAASFLVSLAVGFSAAMPLWLTVTICMVYAVTIQADSASITAGAVAAARPGYRGATLAVHSTLGFGAAVLSPTLVGVVLDTARGDIQVATWAGAFAAMGAMGLAGCAALFFLGRPARS
jgi:predicted MFS family arabinose efflux permease